MREMFQKRAHESVAALQWGLAFLLLTAAALGAFGSTNSIGRYSVRIWQSDDGLPHNSVWAVTQGPHGYLWVGTQQGLVRFDGLRFVGLDESAPVELRHGWITALCVTADESLWIGCEGYGLARMKAGAFTRFSEADGLPSLHVSCLAESKDGSLWIATEGGITRYKEGKFTTFTDKSGLGNNSVRAICQDHEGKIRVATGRGLSSINEEGNISTMNFGMGSISNSLKGVCEDSKRNIWVSSNEGVTREGQNDRAFYGQNEGLPDKKSTVLYRDRSDRVWVGTYSGLACLVNGEVVAKPMNEAGFGDLVYTIYEDREENLWVGARDGLYRLTPARFTTYTAQEGLSCNNAMSVMEDRHGSIWIATWGGGLDEMKDGKIRVYGSTNSLSNDFVLSLREGRDGMWVGMDFDGGVNLLKKERTNAFPKNSAIGQVVHTLYEDREGSLWVGTKFGLNILKGGKLAAYTTAKGLAGNIVMDIFEDSAGHFWLGTDGGLSEWNHGKFKNFTTHDGLPNNSVNAIHEDSEHALWIGTRGGLGRLKDGKIASYTSKQGLFSDEIYEILEDDFGNFWMSCRSGIFRVNRKDFEAVDRGATKTVTSTVFGKADGLVSIQCNGVAKPAGWKSKDGRLWFPTIRGVVAVDSRIKMNDLPPPIMIEEVIADRTVQKFSRETTGRNSAEFAPIKIPPGRGELEIHFAALSLQAPEKNRFQYKMEDVDPKWIDAGTRRDVVYNYLGPGSYRFHVRACNNDGVWNEAGIVLPIVMAPHFWQTWWFKSMIPVAMGLILFAWYRFRMAQLREIERLRVQIAADLHDDVGARLTKVAMVTEFMERETAPTDKSKPHVENIARTTREVIQAMDEIVWTINPKNDTLDNLANYIFQYAQEYFQNTRVRCRMDLPPQLPNCALSTEERHNLFMAVKEALNNVLKHARATEVRISLAVEGNDLRIIVSDDGCGFVMNGSHNGGDGLDNMKERLAHIGGRLEIQSKQNAGTRVEMEVSVG
jgi:ligand-binding sensor domain-containing protein/two-component sensor histidine kinase